ncbi:GTP-binding protein Der [Mycoplasmopsis canis UFG1]|uniref:GTPase Der n=1 Tax=Mycoplasmopsis canis TaxID=29555 RepID=A0A0F6SYF6_9BACT|nr:ribosome biogenesis GTPase Der [Mycoplasmopsis canis]AKF41425.1 GTP-binding protein Der [Mycoplasmopsis canis]AMD81546.1 ribosome biogenesis GTPase Der [Mycoplasmopsis canis PG 14]EIE39436.1 GTP-binding protein Der [Mycoplasmopsis canis PG 14]EIE41225.1 GTP-binding protein Der [Mycoplasmopsis canis UFG1]WQQ12708.1 ribosome biogenesis GTPase Der [Mycoplasmopsis canis]
MKNTVAIIGKPNVGKSTLFNRIIGKKVSIVYDQPGVTRDRLYETINWSGEEIRLIDTGGIEIENRPFQEQIQIQAKIAIEEADVIVFIFDGTNEISNDELFIMNILRKSNKPIIAAANKLESNQTFDYGWYALGVDEIFPISALHGEGVGEVLDACMKYLDFTKTEEEDLFNLAIIGKPNAGKSSLLNNLAKENRSIVSEIAGTTRDSVKSIVEISGKKYNIVDTAGITRKSKLIESVDHYALMRAMNSLAEADLSLVVIDATQPEISHFDSRIIGYALDNNKPLIIVINKWDLVEKETNTMAEFEKRLRNKFHFVPWVPFVFISAKFNQRLNKLVDKLNEVRENLERDIKPSLLSSLILETQLIQPAQPFNGGRLNIYYARKELAKIPTFTFFVNNKKFVHFSYERFLENQLRQTFNFEGCPIKLIFKNKNGLE